MGVISIRSKILVIVLAFLALMGIAFVVYSVFITDNYKQLRREGIEKIVEFETEKVNKKIAEIERGAIHFAISGVLCYDSKSIEIGEESVLEYLFSYPDAEGGGFWFEPYAFDAGVLRLGVYAYYNDALEFYVLDETMYVDDILNIDEYDYHNMSWYLDIIDAVSAPYEVVWTRPYIDDSGSFSLMTTAGAGIYNNDGILVGVSIIDWKIESVVAELMAIKPTDNSFVLLCEPERDYIISNTYGEQGVSSYNSGESLDSLSWDIYADTFVLDGVAYIVFDRVMDNDWSLSVCIPISEMFAEVENQNVRFSIIIIIAVSAMLCTAFLLISGLINKPLKRLTSEVSGIGLGTLDISIDVHSNDELGILAGTFNKMTADLRASIRENALVLAEKERIGAELDVATKIQSSMLPCIFPPFPERDEFEIYASMKPAEEVGGDFYDFFFIDNDTLAVVIADVSDKGVPAALFMVIAKTLIKNNAQSGLSPREVFEIVNNMLCENNDAGMFVTAFLAFLDIPSGRFTYVNAGHNPPLVRIGGRLSWLRTKPSLMLAAMSDTVYTQHEIMLSFGDEFFMYTDGVTEAADVDFDMYGETRLFELVDGLSGLPLEKFISNIQHSIDAFAANMQQSDDITMLALRYNDGGASSESFRVSTTRENIDSVLAFLDKELAKCSDDVRDKVALCADEIFSNISAYAFGSGSGDVVVNVTVDEVVTVVFEDNGIPYNPLNAPSPDLTLPAESRDIGGLGIFIVRNTVDSIFYRRDGDKNILTFVVKIH